MINAAILAAAQGVATKTIVRKETDLESAVVFTPNTIDVVFTLRPDQIEKLDAVTNKDGQQMEGIRVTTTLTRVRDGFQKDATIYIWGNLMTQAKMLKNKMVNAKLSFNKDKTKLYVREMVEIVNTNTTTPVAAPDDF